MDNSGLRHSWNRVCAYLGFISSPWGESFNKTRRDIDLRTRFIEHAIGAVLDGVESQNEKLEPAVNQSTHFSKKYFIAAVKLLDASIPHLIKR